MKIGKGRLTHTMRGIPHENGYFSAPCPGPPEAIPPQNFIISLFLNPIHLASFVISSTSIQFQRRYTQNKIIRPTISYWQLDKHSAQRYTDGTCMSLHYTYKRDSTKKDSHSEHLPINPFELSGYQHKIM